jgi:hypothetical protein
MSTANEPTSGRGPAHPEVTAEDVCPCCILREQLDDLIDVAVIAVAANGHGLVSESEAIVHICRELADYAGDARLDTVATRAVLELARDVFVAGASLMHRD